MGMRIEFGHGNRELGEQYARQPKRVTDSGSSAEAPELMGRTECNRIVNFVGPRALVGQLIDVDIAEAYPHSLRGRWPATGRPAHHKASAEAATIAP